MNFPIHALNACNDTLGSPEESGSGEVGSNVNSYDNSFVVRTTSNNKKAIFVSGTVEHLEQNKSPLSFDSACRNIHIAKSKRDSAKLKKKKKR